MRFLGNQTENKKIIEKKMYYRELWVVACEEKTEGSCEFVRYRQSVLWNWSYYVNYKMIQKNVILETAQNPPELFFEIDASYADTWSVSDFLISKSTAAAPYSMLYDGGLCNRTRLAYISTHGNLSCAESRDRPLCHKTGPK